VAHQSTPQEINQGLCFDVVVMLITEFGISQSELALQPRARGRDTFADGSYQALLPNGGLKLLPDAEWCAERSHCLHERLIDQPSLVKNKHYRVLLLEMCSCPITLETV